MLRNRLFKRFGAGGEDELNPKATNLSNPQLSDNPDNSGELLNIPGFIASPQETWDWQKKLNPEVPKLNTDSYITLDPSQVPTEEKKFSKSDELTKSNDAGSLEKSLLDQLKDQFKGQESAAIGLGLLGVNTALSYNQDLENQQKLTESIQQRNSKPLYDYNYMYGRTTSGGTEYQPTIKAEMGAKINKRYASEGMNDVEIEGGEYIQLPNLETEMAEGPSHSNGGIPTNLPDQTRVYSNDLKPEGSKKTFAQIAKNYDTTSYKKTLENPFAKQVDKDTAGIMMQRNQKILDELFRDQQIMNGNSNGEVEAKNGASINNPGFKSLPGYVQAKITANMAKGAVTEKDPIPTYKPGTKSKVAKIDPKLSLLDAQVPGLQSTLPSGVYGEESNLDLFKRNYDWFIKDLEAQGETLDPKNKEQMRRAQVAYTEEVRNRALKAGYTPEEADKLSSEMGFIPEEGDQRSIDSKLGLYTASRQLPNFEPKTPVPPGGDSGTPPDGVKINDVTPGKTGKYTRGQFPLYQAIPEAMGLAQAQEIYSYAIPEVDAPYVRPQTLNIQSELQDIDNSAISAMRAGADPNMAYIAGLDAKQKAFQSKQNYDAQGRSQADMANAQMSMQADQFNAQAFDRVYNNLIGQARDAQSGEKLAAVASLTEKKAKFDQDENLKALGIPIVSPTYNWNSTGNPNMPEGMQASLNFYNYMKEQEAKQAAQKTTAKKGMYKKSKK
jgi:hypothetical protein